MYLYTAPSNPSSPDNRISCMLKVNGTDSIKVDTIPEGYAGGENSCREWCMAVIENVRATKVCIGPEKGVNTISISPVSPGFVLEKTVLVLPGNELKASRLGAGN